MLLPWSPLHGVRFPTARLAVGKQTYILSINHVLY